MRIRYLNIILLILLVSCNIKNGNRSAVEQADEIKTVEFYIEYDFFPFFDGIDNLCNINNFDESFNIENNVLIDKKTLIP